MKKITRRIRYVQTRDGVRLAWAEAGAGKVLIKAANWMYLLGKPYEALKFGTPALYRVVRHPLYVGWFFAFWMTPLMTFAPALPTSVSL